jgi:hypothetical protein
MSGFTINPQHLARLRSLARSLGVAVWQDEAGRVHQQSAGCEPREVDTSTLSRAGWVRCPRARLDVACQLEGEPHILGRRVACGHCGALSVRLPAGVLEQFIAGNKKPAGEAG